MWLAGGLLLLSLYQLIEGLIGVTKVKRLPEGQSKSQPKVSVIIAACNEEQALKAAVETITAQEYENREVIIVNDRSTDQTGKIADQLAGVSTLHIENLPAGWLGKNHALYQGANLATGDWLLFTDADVHFKPNTIKRAIAYAEANQLDHLTMPPGLKVKGYWLNAWAAFFVMAFMALKHPHKANDPQSKVSIGVGAFNLIKASTYRAIGTHRAISLRPDDDLKLGELVKRNGFRQEVVIGSDQIEVEWYTSLNQAIRGLEKNTFAGLDYNLPLAVTAAAFLILIMVWPYLALLITPHWLYAATIATQLSLFLLSSWPMYKGRSLALAVGYPIAALLFAYTIARSMYLTLSRGGIVWRGTFYPLQELKRQR